jgi:hypothetical protein
LARVVEQEDGSCAMEMRGGTSMRALYLSLGAFLVVAFTVGYPFPAAANPPGQWARTESHDPCTRFSVTRNAYFGDMHIHTTQSIDAVLFNTLTTPRQAYEFAKGAQLGLAPFDGMGNPAHFVQLGRPLDFAAITDHSEGFGAQDVCFDSSAGGFLDGYNSTQCQALRTASVSNDPQAVLQVFLNFLLPVVLSPTPTIPVAVCSADGSECSSRESVFWLDHQQAAEENYDRSSACAFTSFVAYEWTGTPNYANLHRNVIFRNAAVPAVPVTYLDQQTPRGLWASLTSACQDAVAGCDWLAIPHNSNLSGANGLMFLPENAPATGTGGTPLTAADAATRAAMEPLVEIYQHKGASECRPGVDSTDEACGFELVSRTGLLGASNPSQTFTNRLAFVRNALKEGLVQEQALGVNPFRLGIIASTDTHNGDPGNVREDSYVGHTGVNDDSPAHNQLNITSNNAWNGEHSPAGLAVVWAEENSRDALFAAMRRRETYGTSGPRHTLRFFAGNYAATMCTDPDFATTGYRDGTPMGAEVGPISGGTSPVFTVLAMKDAGDPGHPGTQLQRVQIIKGWVDGTGAHEKVFDVAGDANNGASVALATCTPTGTGADSLCTTWQDPEFDPTERAFYYARVLENPTCRWSTYVCNANNIDCSTTPPAAFALCCDVRFPKTIQERSWSSPIWYRPEGLGPVQASVRYGRRPGTDRLKLKTTLAQGASHDLSAEDVTITVTDDDTVFSVTIPAGRFRNGKVWNFGNVKYAKFSQRGTEAAKLSLRTVPMDLSHADKVDHMVEVAVHVGPTFETSQSRLWTFDGRALATK